MRCIKFIDWIEWSNSKDKREGTPARKGGARRGKRFDNYWFSLNWSKSAKSWMGEWFRNLIGAAKFRILRFGVVQHFAVSNDICMFRCLLPVERALWPSGKGAWLGTGICTPGLPACFFGGKPTQLVPQKMDRLRRMIYYIYFTYLFWEGVSHPISWMKFPPCQRVLFAFQFPIPLSEAHQISTEKEALLRSLALLRERQKAPVAGTATRVGTTFWPIARWVSAGGVFFAASFHGRENAVDFPCYAEFMPLQWICALGVQQERHYFEESNTKIFDGL